MYGLLLTIIRRLQRRYKCAVSLLFGVNKEPWALTLNTTFIAIYLDNCGFLQCQYIAQLWHSYWRDSIGITLGFCRQYFLDWWWSGSLYRRLHSQSNWKVRLNLLRSTFNFYESVIRLSDHIQIKIQEKHFTRDYLAKCDSSYLLWHVWPSQIGWNVTDSTTYRGDRCRW